MQEGIHSFYIPVMGTAFTIDSPLKVAKYGISSVISAVDDTLIETMRRYHAQRRGRPYSPIPRSEHDARARRITAYLNLLDELVSEDFEQLKASPFEEGSEITRYFDLLHDRSPLKQLYRKMLSTHDPAEKEKLQAELRKRIKPGTIDLNIMTKVDRRYFDKEGKPLPSEFSDALAALRGYANSSVSSSIVFSAGINSRLYSYIEQFQDFHADEDGFLKKKITIKVSDYRSAYTQGKFLAKKGLWVSEYRIESGLNCGGHAFGQGGSLMGPNLEAFKEKRSELIEDLHKIYNKARAQKKKKTFPEPHPVRITAQGGVGTAAEHQFLMEHYDIDAVGWGTAFLLVPEATTVDPETLENLCKATKNEIYLSDSSPLGIPFNNLRTSASERRRIERIRSEKPGSPCIKGFLAFNTEFTKSPICTASRAYQKKKIEQLKSLNLAPEVFEKEIQKVLSKSCICNDLGGAAIKAYGLNDPDDPGTSPAICPGPGLAYFSKIVTLKEMVDHIYGRINLLDNAARPNMFITELDLNIDFLQREINEFGTELNEQKRKYLSEFKSKLLAGVDYYKRLFEEMEGKSQNPSPSTPLEQLEEQEKRIVSLIF